MDKKFWGYVDVPIKYPFFWSRETRNNKYNYKSKKKQEFHLLNRKQPTGTTHTHFCDKTKLEKNVHIGTAQNSN